MKKVLVIDDAALTRNLLKSILMNSGYHVLEAEDGDVGVAQYKKENPDLVLCDINMPAMDGLTCLEQILEYHPQARVIMCTSYGEQCYADEAVKRGAKAYIVKPINTVEVVKVIKDVMWEVREQPVNYKELLLERAGQAGVSNKEALDFASAFKSMTGVSMGSSKVDLAYLREKEKLVTVGANVYLSSKMSTKKINQLVDIYRGICS